VHSAGGVDALFSEASVHGFQARGLRPRPGKTPRDNGAAFIPDGARRLASVILYAASGQGPRRRMFCGLQRTPIRTVTVELQPQRLHGPQVYSPSCPFVLE
jgi:hypothetical protein